MRELKLSTAANVMIFMTDSIDRISGKTGLTLTITASKDGAAFTSISPTVTERGSGWYNLALTTTHTNTLGDLALHITGTDADPSDVLMRIIAIDKADAAGMGLSRLDSTIGSRMATFAYTAPDNTSVAAAATSAATAASNSTALLARVGAFTGSGVNTVLGFLKAMLSKTAAAPSDVGGTFDPATDSVEAARDELSKVPRLGATFQHRNVDTDATATVIIEDAP